MEKMFTINNLSKQYTRGNWAVKNFNLKIMKNEVFCLVGPNGSGKTTIINSILGIITPDKGEMLFNGYNRDSTQFKEMIAYVPDELLLPDTLTGKEYLDFINAMYSRAKKSRINDEIIELYDMATALSNPIETYSHGMKKKMQLIAAFMLDRQLIILDEPFSGLDIESVIITKRLLNKFAEHKGSIFLSTHDLIAAEGICDRVAIIANGEKITEGRTSNLIKEHNCKDLEEVFVKVSIMQKRSDQVEKIINNF